MIIGNVQVHTINKGLIKESLFVKVFGRKFKVEVIEEVGDIMEFELEEKTMDNENENHAEKDGVNEMIISDSDSSDDASEEGSETKDDEKEEKKEEKTNFGQKMGMVG